jgi:caa(3)-type oxidase subunit IV
MSTVDDSGFYCEIWAWLVGLLIAGTVVVFLPIPKLVALLLVFGVAAVKAGLVIRHYMHLKAEHLLIYLIGLLPVLFVVILVVALLPDIAFRR